MHDIQEYEQQVYAGVLGKVIGVYAGRPFEGWTKARIEERWGFVDRYVHEDVGKPLVVADDDISGTLTFIRAMEAKPDWIDMKLVEEGARAERNGTANLSPFLIRGAFLATFLNKDYNPDTDYLPPDLAKAAEAQLRGDSNY